jgi:hypothetical protein
MHTHTENHTKSSRAPLMATLTQIIVVLLQLSLAGALFHKVDGAFERESVPVAKAGTAVADANAARGDPKWLALVRVPLPPPLLPQGHMSAVRSRRSPSTPGGAAWL